MIKFTCYNDISRIIYVRNELCQKILSTHHYIEKRKLWEYIGGLSSINIHESGIKKRTNQLINDISSFNNEHIIQCYNVNQYNIPEEPCYISSMTPTGFINVQYESRCYANLSCTMHK